MIFLRLFCALCVSAVAAHAAEPDWPKLEQEALALLQSYVRIPSINPPADTRATANLIKGALEKHGISAELIPTGPNGQTNLLARLPGRDRKKKPLLLMNHMDVVPVDPKAWNVDPFGAEIRDGYLWGRGSMDMKGTGVIHLMSLVALREAGIVPNRDIVMLCTSDEETNGTYGIRWMIDHRFADIDAEYAFDEGAFGTRDLLADNKLVFGISVGEKQTAWLRLRATGTAGHGSQPIPDNANMILLDAVRKAMELPPSKPNENVEQMMRTIGKLAENKFTAAIRKNTVSLTTLNSGVGSPPKANVIPSTAEATLDCRLLPGINADEFVSEMKARINDPRVTIEFINTPDDPGASNSRTPLFSTLSDVLRRYHPEAVVTPILIPYGTDSVKLRKKGVTAYGFTPMIVDAATVASMHSDGERVPVSEFLKGIHIFFDVLRSDF